MPLNQRLTMSLVGSAIGGLVLLAPYLSMVEVISGVTLFGFRILAPLPLKTFPSLLRKWES